VDRIPLARLAELAEDRIPPALSAGWDVDRIRRDPLAESASADATALGCCDSRRGECGSAQHWAPVTNEASGAALLIVMVDGAGVERLQHHQLNRLGRLPSVLPLILIPPAG